MVMAALDVQCRNARHTRCRMPGTVLINARAARRPELGGVERWARELSIRLPQLRPDAYRVVGPPGAMVHRSGHLWEQLILPLHRGELLLCPANLAPLASRRTVVVLHDVAPLREPSWYSPAYVRWQRFVLPRIARSARRVITPSAFAAGEIHELLGVAADRIAVIPGACDTRFSPEADAGRARAALQLPDGPYVLTVGSRTARKNLAVLDAPARALAQDGISLVAAGGDRPQFRADENGGAVRQLGPVSDELLAGLPAGASAFVLPSLYEGFGLTALEAMASGVPVVAADAGSLPEVCGAAAQLVDPRDPASIGSAIAGAIAEPEPWRAAGLARSAAFSWEATAGAVDAELGALLGWPTR